MAAYLFPRERAQNTSPSPKIVLAPPSPIAPLTNGLPSPPASNHSQDSPDSPLDVAAASEGSRLNSPVVPTSPERTLSPLAPRKVSKFRRVTPLRKPQAPLPSSPLAQANKDIHSRNNSVVSSPSPQQAPVPPPVANQSELQLSLHSTTAQSPFVSPSLSERALPPPPKQSDVTQKPIASVVAPSFTPLPPVSKSSSSSSTKQGVTLDHKTITSRSLPYRPGFQPKGRPRDLTDDFLALRKIKRDGAEGSGRMTRVERNKLERRLEKLIDLHFPSNPPSMQKSSINTTGAPKRRPAPSLNATKGIRRSSSIFDLDTYKNINLRDAGDLWKNVLTGNLGDSSKPDKRAMEQRITPWEEDSAVSKCPLCLASFHPLTNRKHHCRLCGRIICSLPVKNPQRPATCSLLFVVDSKTGKIEEVGEGVDYGVSKRRNASVGKTDEIDNDEKFLKGVRICRECRPVLLREQYQQERLHVPTFVKLHEAFIALESEIEEALPQFQELILALNHNDQPTREASAARKRILEAFTQYDALAKKIKELPCPNGLQSSQGRVQSAILMRANLFLQKNMFPLQSLPNPARNKGKEPGGPSAPDQSMLGGPIEGAGIDPDSELAQALQPLLEQEALLESFIEEATAQRKFEDVKSLRVNLKEIRSEIENMLDGVDVNSKKGKGKAGI
ncbi:Rabenosyn-5 [Leucoagaricus sp. SymC.cos]|nr:Rabenosyn-5 [Leucoagaricus sp. SymC.cos]